MGSSEEQIVIYVKGHFTDQGKVLLASKRSLKTFLFETIQYFLLKPK